MKSHEKESIHPIALSFKISSLQDETKSSSVFKFDLQIEEESDFLHRL